MSHPCLVESNSAAKDEQFYETVEVEDTKVPFKLDSGVKATVFLEDLQQPQVQTPTTLEKDKNCTAFLFKAQTEALRRSSVDHQILCCGY